MAVATSDSRRLEIRLLGEPAIYAGGALQNVKLPSKSFELLCSLALKAGEPQDRAKLAFTLWPDDSEEAAKAELRRHLYLLRRAIASAADEAQLAVTTTTLMWQPDGPTAIDVVEFVRLSECPDTLDCAVAMYTGDLLAHVYDEWLEAPRERLRKQQLQNLLALANRHVHTDPKRALVYAQSALVLDPWSEETVRCVMYACTNLGDRAGAVHAYSEFARRLREEFGAEPTVETQRVLRIARTTESRNTNLPRQFTSFVTREEVLSEIAALIETCPLVTLVGAGGVGKTRTALQIGEELLDRHSDGVWFAELAPISDPSLASHVIAHALGVRESPNRPILDTLITYLKRRRLLLILDNCEHVIDEARAVATAILQGCPDVRILATSREWLNIAGEHVFRVPSLAVPSTAEALSSEQASRYEAVQLFTDRARSVDERFSFNDKSAPYIGEICRRLDGIPLAIELAAARVKVLSPKQLGQLLDERFRVLTGGDRSALPRHRTMRALIDWSYDLLSDDERALFRKLSIFAGGFTLETAAAVCSEREMDEIVVLDLLSSLVDKSLVQTEAVGNETRYRLLESTRQYAREKLTDAGEEYTTAHAHARAFLTMAEQVDETWEATPDRAWLAQVEPELENFRAALSWAFGAQGDVALGQRLAGTLRLAWWYLAAAEGRRWVQTAQECVSAETSSPVVATLDLADAYLAAALTQHKASLAAAERVLARYRIMANVLGVAHSKRLIGIALVVLGKIGEGEALLPEALAEFRALGARKSASVVLGHLAWARLFAGDVVGARQLYSEALTAARAAGAERNEAVIVASLAEAEFRAGDAAAAVQLVREAMTLCRVFHDARLIALALHNEAAYLVALRRYDEGRTSAREALAGARDTQYSSGVGWALQHLAAVAALQSGEDERVGKDRRRAARILGYVEARLAALETLREYTERQEYDTMMPALRDALGEDELSKLMAEGSMWSEDQAVAEAMLI
jgi:predicted ATPase/DNA-binding SARP family transcriptional activator